MSMIQILWEWLNLKWFLNFYFLNMDISLDSMPAFTIFSTFIENILMQETVSRNGLVLIS